MVKKGLISFVSIVLVISSFFLIFAFSHVKKRPVNNGFATDYYINIDNIGNHSGGTSARGDLPILCKIYDKDNDVEPIFYSVSYDDIGDIFNREFGATSIPTRPTTESVEGVSFDAYCGNVSFISNDFVGVGWGRVDVVLNCDISRYAVFENDTFIRWTYNVWVDSFEYTPNFNFISQVVDNAFQNFQWNYIPFDDYEGNTITNFLDYTVNTMSCIGEFIQDIFQFFKGVFSL